MSDPKLPANKSELVKDMISQYLDGKSIQTIAQEHGVSDKRLYALMVRESEEEWKEAQMATALERIQRCQDSLDAAKDAVEIARAREQARIAMWTLEKTCRRIYGEDVRTLAGQGVVNLQINLGADISTKVIRPHTEEIEASQGDPGES